MKRIKWLLCVGAAGAQMIGVAAAAQDASTVLKGNPSINPDRINEEQRQRLQERVAPELAPPSTPRVEAPPPAEITANGQPAVTFTLRAVKFDPSSYLSAQELDALVQPLIGHEVSLVDLQKIVDRINILYAKRGLTTARAALPAQQIDQGIVEIRLVEGRIGAIGVEGGSQRGQRYVEAHAAPEKGTLAAPSALENRLRLFNLNNDAQLRARLSPGGSFGTTDVVLTMNEPRRVSADAFVDNNGFSSTGEAEVGVVVRGYRLLGEADRFSAVAVASRGVKSGNASLSTPIGDRFRIGTSLSYGRTHVLFGALSALDVRGTSFSFGGDAAALVTANDRTTVVLTAAVQATLSNTRIGGQRVVENQALNATGGATVGYAVPGFALTIQNQATFATVREELSGHVDQPLIFQGSALVAKAIVPHFQVRLRADWQLATQRNLPGILQYQIGGSRSTRAFSPGIAAGDNGLSAAIEAAYGFNFEGLAVEPFVFVDHAQESVPTEKLSGQSVGAGFSLLFSPTISVRGTVATSIRERGLPPSTRAFFSTNFHI